MRDLKIQLYLENDKSERFDLIRNGISLKIGTFNSEVIYKYDTYDFQNNLKSIKNTSFQPKKLNLDFSIRDEAVYTAFTNFINRQPKGLKLYYSNFVKEKEVFCYVDIERANAVQKKRSDQRDFEIQFNMVSPWFKLKNIYFPTTEQQQYVWYGGRYPLKYSGQPVRSYGETRIINNGQLDAPFMIVCEAGAVDVKWQLLDSSNNPVYDSKSGAELSGQIDYYSEEEIVIDNFNNRIYTGNTDISYKRDRYLLSFFNIPVGEYILKIEGTNSGLRGLLYESYQQV